MSQHTNSLGQPIGAPLPDWKAPPAPPRTPMVGRTCTVLPLDPAAHSADLHAANILEPTGRLFTYLATEPFPDAAAHRAWADQAAKSADPLFHAIVSHATGKAAGIASFMRIDPANGVIEVGHINFAPPLQQTVSATEAMYLMMARVFELGYRRYEWKCDSNNAPSRSAAARLGFQYEGRFRQAIVTKGRNRDTDWFSMLDSEWPALRAAFETWLDPANFDASGRQRESLSGLTMTARCLA